MKKVLIFIVILVILAGLGYFGFKFFWPASKNTSGGPPKTVQLCDIDSQTCGVVPKSANPGILQITIANEGKPVGNLEVDVGVKPGATKYYMGLTDTGGVISVDGIPAGNYFIYFNNGNFPVEFGNPPLVPVSVLAGQTTKKSIDLTSK
jgi:hypothetical protein